MAMTRISLCLLLLPALIVGSALAGSIEETEWLLFDSKVNLTVSAGDLRLARVDTGGSWSSVNNSSYDHNNGVVIGDRIYHLSNLNKSRNEVYDPQNDSWSPFPDSYFDHHALGATSYNGKLYVFGAPSEHEVYDPATMTWSNLSSSSYNHNGDGSAAIGDRIHVVSQSRWNSEIYDPVNNTWSTFPTAADYGHLGGAVVDGKLFWWGLDNQTHEIYDLATGQWSNVASSVASHLGGDARNGLVYAVGRYSAELEVYDPSTDQWQVISNASSWKGKCSFYSDDLYCAGGLADQHEVYSFTTEAFPFGVLESIQYDSGGNSSLVGVTWNSTEPSGTQVGVAVRSAPDQPSLNSTSFGTFQPGDRWFQYQVTLQTTDTNVSPIMHDLTLTYNVHPQIILGTPNGEEADSNYTLSWVATDPDNDAQINLSYDLDRVLNGNEVLITTAHEDSATSYDWNTSAIPTGNYSIMAQISDGLNSSYTYSPGVLFINHTVPPPPDQDGDGIPDSADGCPGIPGSSTWPVLGCPDDDGDGVANGSDVFPSDPTQTNDTDGDGFGDNATGTNGDECSLEAGNSSWPLRGCPDDDGDGVANGWDAFPSDPTQTNDTDGDRFGDNATGTNGDDCPLQAGNSSWPLRGCPDDDGDGLENGSDEFPQDASQTNDTDSDGFGDNPNGTNPDLCPLVPGNQSGCPPSDGGDGGGDGGGNISDGQTGPTEPGSPFNAGPILITIAGAGILVALVAAILLSSRSRRRGAGPQPPQSTVLEEWDADDDDLWQDAPGLHTELREAVPEPTRILPDDI